MKPLQQARQVDLVRSHGLEPTCLQQSVVRPASARPRNVAARNLLRSKDGWGSRDGLEECGIAQHAISPNPSLQRRGLLAAATALLPFPAAPALAAKTVQLTDGTAVEVYEHGLSLRIVALRGSVPAAWVVDFRGLLGKHCGFSLDMRGQLLEIFNDLKEPTKKQSAGTADVVTLGDSWLALAIQQDLLQPIQEAEHYRWYQALSPAWRQLVRRDSHGRPDPRGQVWGAPYRWGATLIGYSPTRLRMAGGHPVRDWADLLQPALKGRIALPEAPRDLVGIALKTLGLPFRATAQDMERAGVSAEDLRARVQELRRQTLLFSNNEHVRALQAGDVWAAVGWSADIVGVAERSSKLRVVAPWSGTLLWADVWAVPKQAQGGDLLQGPSPLLPVWLEFSVVPTRAASLGTLRVGATPSLLPPSPPAAAAGALPAAPAADDEAEAAGVLLHAGNGFMPGDDVLQRSEFSVPLDADTLSLYVKALKA